MPHRNFLLYAVFIGMYVYYSDKEMFALRILTGRVSIMPVSLSQYILVGLG